MVPLGDGALQVSRFCLGTMTWGTQNTQAQAFAQLDFAFERGVNFIDTAEMYPVPPTAETFTLTETILGRWLVANPEKRARLVVATKCAGPSPVPPMPNGERPLSYVRGGESRYTAAILGEAIDASLRRLGTDTIDLYQLHWPERGTRLFGGLGWEETPWRDETATALEVVLEGLRKPLEAGKIRRIGVSNETPWGVMKFLHAAEGIADRIVSVQNAYSLLNRTYELSLAETSVRERCGLLAYAPLAGGVLSGKYLDGAAPKGARFSLSPGSNRYASESGALATRKYCDLAREHGYDPAVMAHAFVFSRPFLGASIAGATTLAQLETAISAEGVVLSEEVLAGIEAIHNLHTYPCP